MLSQNRDPAAARRAKYETRLDLSFGRNMMRHKSNLRIGIIGAGAGGLSTAEALKEKGYTDIVVFEKRDRAGGQVYTFSYGTPDGRTILCEMGSVQPFAAGRGALGHLIKRYNLQFGRTITESKAQKFRFYSINKREFCRDFQRSPIGFPFTTKNILLIFFDLMKLFRYLYKYRALGQAGYLNLSAKQLADLAISKEQWVDERGFFLIAEDLKYFIGGTLTLMNTEIQTVPATTLLKLLLYCIKSPVRYLNGSFRAMREGYQELWTRVAANHQVHYNSEVRKIVRNEKEIIVEAADGLHKFDKIIVTCASFEFARFLQQTHEEKDVFSRVHYAPGWRAAFLGKNLPCDAAYGVYEPCVDSKYLPALTVLVPEGQVEKDTWLYGCIISTTNDAPIEPALKSIENFLRDHFSGQVIQWVKTVYWPQYSPYFSYEDVKQGVYQKLEGLQGKNNTYYAGDVASSGSNSVVCDYAYDLVERFF